MAIIAQNPYKYLKDEPSVKNLDLLISYNPKSSLDEAKEIYIKMVQFRTQQYV